MELDDNIYSKLKAKYSPNIPPLKKKLEKSGFFEYLFMHMSRIKKWNNNEDLIEFKYMGLKMSLADDFKSRVDNIFINCLVKIQAPLKELVKNGWKMGFLSIYDYNILINFHQFFNTYHNFVKNDDFMMNDFQQLEREYVKITYRQYYIDAIISIFNKYLITENKSYEDDKKTYDSVIKNLKHFFKKSSLPHSLRELILAKNITDLRCYYKWSDLFPLITAEVVPHEWYNCDEETYISIVKYFKKLKKRIKQISGELEQMRWLKSNAIIDREHEPEILIELYEESGRSWKRDNKNYFYKFLVMIQTLSNHITRLLYRSWDVIDNEESNKSVKLCNDYDLPGLFSDLKIKLSESFNLYNEDSGTLLSVDNIINSEYLMAVLNTKVRKQLYESFTDIMDILYKISLILLSYGDLALQSGFTQNSYLSYMVSTPKEFAGLPVFHIYDHYVELIWLICSYFKNEKFVDLDEKILGSEKSLREMREEITRIDINNIIGSALGE